MIFLICAALHNIFLFFILSNKSCVCVDFYLKLNLINKFIKHNQINYLHYNIKYFYLHFYFSFSHFFRKKITNQKWFCWVVFFLFFFFIEFDSFFRLFLFSYSKKKLF
jgi:hypothetical protein